MRYLALGDILELYRRIIEETGGAMGIRDMNGLMSALGQPKMTFEGADLYPSVAEKAAALGFSLIMNHPFLDGNKRVGHAAPQRSRPLAVAELTQPLAEFEGSPL
jgi:death-on-curing protein